MITANVKDVGAASVLNLTAVPSGKVQAPGGADSFQDILNKQTYTADTAKRSDQDAGNTGKTAAEKTDKGSQQITRKDRTKDVQPKGEGAGPAEEDAELPEEIAENVKEAVAQLLIQISDAFGVSVEELQGLMQEMGISEPELLLPQQLGNLILEASGAEGSFELVTDGELYEKFRSLMETGEQLAGEVESKAGMSREELIRRLPVEAETEPVVEIRESEIVPEIPETVETRETDSQPVETQGQELLTPGAPQEAPRAESGENGKSGSRQQSSEGEHREIFGGFENNPVARQNPLETAAYEMRAESASQTMDADTQNIMRQILDYMKVQIQPETTSLEMQLHPESLGSLQIQLASKGGAVTAQFIAENEAVKAALETQMIQLRENFEEQGIRVEAIEVSVQTGRFEQAYEDQERGGEEQRQSSRAKSGRRLRLDAQLTPDQLENLTADEKLAADMMAANGGTVDYMA